MTQDWIREQMEIILVAGAKARQSKEAARRFLIDAGIIKPRGRTSSSTKKK